MALFNVQQLLLEIDLWVIGVFFFLGDHLLGGEILHFFADELLLFHVFWGGRHVGWEIRVDRFFLSVNLGAEESQGIRVMKVARDLFLLLKMEGQLERRVIFQVQVLLVEFSKVLGRIQERMELSYSMRNSNSWIHNLRFYQLWLYFIRIIVNSHSWLLILLKPSRHLSDRILILLPNHKALQGVWVLRVAIWHHGLLHYQIR